MAQGSQKSGKSRDAGVVADIRLFEWSARHASAATYLLPAVIICLAGIILHHPARETIAASGAVSHAAARLSQIPMTANSDTACA